jgi:hypothetical protein
MICRNANRNTKAKQTKELIKSLVLLALSFSVISTQVHALEITGGAVVIATSAAAGYFSTVMSLSGNKEEVRLIINDTQDYIQSGTTSAFLQNKILEIQATDSDLSNDDAIELLLGIGTIRA